MMTLDDYFPPQDETLTRLLASGADREAKDK